MGNSALREVHESHMLTRQPLDKSSGALGRLSTAVNITHNRRRDYCTSHIGEHIHSAGNNDKAVPQAGLGGECYAADAPTDENTCFRWFTPPPATDTKPSETLHRRHHRLKAIQSTTQSLHVADKFHYISCFTSLQ